MIMIAPSRLNTGTSTLMYLLLKVDEQLFGEWLELLRESEHTLAVVPLTPVLESPSAQSAAMIAPPQGRGANILAVVESAELARTVVWVETDIQRRPGLI